MSMLFSSIMGNSQKLDGGAMFGNAPKAMWAKWAVPDDRNRIDLCCRALLVETDNHKILFETGIGAYMEPKYKDRFGVQEDEHVLLDSLQALDLTHEDISAVILSHLHFDHAGGLLSRYREGKTPELLFPNANYYVGAEAWSRANAPHPRDRASFVPEINRLLEESDRLNLIEHDEESLHFDELTVGFFISSGHTPGMLCSDLRTSEGRMIFCADLIPGRHWVHVPITMGYDRFPEQLIDEKKRLLTSVHEEGGSLFFTHDPECAAADVRYNEERRRFEPTEPRGSLVRRPF